MPSLPLVRSLVSPNGLISRTLAVLVISAAPSAKLPIKNPEKLGRELLPLPDELRWLKRGVRPDGALWFVTSSDR